MKSSDKLTEKGYLANSPGYSLLALYMPLTLLAAAIFLVEALLAVNLHSVLLIASGGISGIAASIYCDFMKDIKSSRTAANVRGGVIIIIAIYLFSSLFRRGVFFNERFVPDYINILPSIGALYIWISVVSLKQLFIARRQFEIYTELYRGERLQNVLFEDSGLLQYTDENINETCNNYFFQLLLIFILTLSCTLYNISLPPGLYILLFVIFTGGICLFGFFEIIKWEHYYAGEGIGFSTYDRTRRILVMILLSVFCLVMAFLLTSDRSFLSFSLIVKFFVWIISFFPRRPVSLDRVFASENLMLRDTVPAYPSPSDEITQSPILELIIKYGIIILKYSFFILVAGGFIWFMISPILNRGEVAGKLPFYRRLWRIISQWFRSLLAAIVSFFDELKNGKLVSKLKKYDAEEIRRAAETVMGAYSPVKKRDIRRSVTLFARLIIWGSEVCNVTWKPVHAPGEYCAILAAAPNVILLNKGIIRCGEIFEKALYSAEILSDEEYVEFKNLVEEITNRDRTLFE